MFVIGKGVIHSLSDEKQCKHCGTKLENYNRAHRNLIQSIFTRKALYRCGACGKKTFIHLSD